MLLFTLIPHLKDHIDGRHILSYGIKISQKNCWTLDRPADPFTFQNQKDWVVLRYFPVQYVEDHNVKWTVWQTYLQFIWVWLNQYSKGIPLGKQESACLGNMLFGVTYCVFVEQYYLKDQLSQSQPKNSRCTPLHFQKYFLVFEGMGRQRRYCWEHLSSYLLSLNKFQLFC